MAQLKVNTRVEVRAAIKKEGKVNEQTGEKRSDFLVIKVEDDEANNHEFIDRDVENEKLYKKGQSYDMVLVANYSNSFKGGWCRFEIKSIKKVGE